VRLGMPLSITELGSRVPPEGWPNWVVTVPYVGSAHPQSENNAPISVGANCQRFAYAVLGLFGRNLPPHRSSELWEDSTFDHVTRSHIRDLDLVLFNSTADAWGAHVAVALGGRLLHLCAEAGRPALWQWTDFAARKRYATLVGAVRVPARER
jgi:hypothetical protein